LAEEHLKIKLHEKDKLQPSKSTLIHIKRFNKLFDLNFLLQVMYAKNVFLTKAWLQIQIIFQILNLSSYTRLNPKHLVSNSLKSHPPHQGTNHQVKALGCTCAQRKVH
jgi:hypothetical protein